MVAFVGRPLSSTASGPRKSIGRSTLFRIEERLWGELPAAGAGGGLDLITIQDYYFDKARDFERSWFVLAGRRREQQPQQARSTSTGGGSFTYFVDFSCCSYGLVEPTDHPWAKEFRSFAAQRKRAALRVEIHSNYVPLAGVRLRLAGKGNSAVSSSSSHSTFFWEGISSHWAPMNVSVPPGEYTLGIEKPHFTLPEANRQISILPGACGNVRVELVPTTFISGTITDSRGGPPPHPQQQQQEGLDYLLTGEVRMEESLWDTALAAARGSLFRLMSGWGTGSSGASGLPPRKNVHYWLTPDENGRFHAQVLPGRYRLSAMSRDSHDYVFPPPIPKTYFPGVLEPARATEIVVRAGGSGGGGDAPQSGGALRDIEFRLPEYRGTRRVEVELVREVDRSPVSGEVVAYTGRLPSTKGREFRITGWTQKLTDSRGRATFEVWEFLDYDLHIHGVAAVAGPGDDEERRLRPEIPAGMGPVSRRFVIRR